MGLSVRVLAASGLGLVAGSCACAQPQGGDAHAMPQFHWSRSLPVDSLSPAIGELGGTETRALVGLGGKLYAGIGYWSDSETESPQLPGAQVLVLDAPSSRWRVDLQLDGRIGTGPRAGARTYMAISVLDVVTFRSDMRGKGIPPTSVLLAGVWRRDRDGGTEIFYRIEGDRSWKKSVLAPAGSPGQQARGFFLYTDKVTKTERVFAGTGVPKGDQPGGIWSGVFDSEFREIHWNPAPEAWDKPPDTEATLATIRVASFAECGNTLYAAAYDCLYERQDGGAPVWKKVFQRSVPSSNVKGGTGFRGLTMLDDPCLRRQVLLVAQEARPFVILKIDPRNGFRASVDLNISEYLGRRWNRDVGYGIAAYNNMTPYPGRANAQAPSLLIGFEAALPQQPAGRFKKFELGAHFLVRHPDGRYDLRDVIDQSLRPSPVLLSVRALTASPFPEDPAGTLYAGGFDANSVPVHNTAWIYRGVPVPLEK